jgi:hypothetical protein
MNLKTEEWFAGTKSFSNYMQNFANAQTFTIDNDSQFDVDLVDDVRNRDLPKGLDIFWASVICTACSVASMSHHWINEDTATETKRTPKSDTARLTLSLLDHTIKQISLAKPRKWYIENPRGVMRKIIEPYFKKYGVTFRRVTVTYCQYGDTRMKPTDIWTNDMDWKPRPMCKNGSPCHEPAPRGSKTGTQGLKNSKDRSRIPFEIFKEIHYFDKISRT